MYDLIIAEKPNAAKRIAEALADTKVEKINEKGVNYYKIKHNNKLIYVVSAVGHIFSLTQKQGKKSEYPVFDIEWQPSYKVNKNSAFTKKYLDVIKKLAKNANEITIATDYDIEGELIGLNVIRYACNRKDANRMKFSTLTKDDLLESYKNRKKTLDWGQGVAGETRHILDWFWGINTSRALMQSIRKAGSFKLMSTGRVQGPALKIIVEREQEIENFKPKKYWQIELINNNKDKKIIDSWYEEEKIWEEEKAKKIFNKIKEQNKSVVKKIESKEFKQKPPAPFDLTSLQVEAYRLFNISPKKTLEIAQDLYTQGIISYPRTSSQELPEKIGFVKIIKLLSNLYPNETSILLSKKKLKPNNGKKKDPAHPAIYPTGLKAKLNGDNAKIYDLIVRRFFVTFGDDAIRETLKIKIECNNEIFIAKGTTTKIKGWHELYGKYANFKEEELPVVKENEELIVIDKKLHEKETQPPKRYTESSLIKELEKRGLGTKATRANIIETLFQRGYVDGKPIKATNLGIKTCNTLKKYCPEILDEKMTRNFEEKMELIREGKEKEEKTLTEAKKVVKKIVDEFKKKEEQIGKALLEANIETAKEMNSLGKCKNCGGDLSIKRGKFGFFGACSNYPDCKITFSLPKNVLVRGTDKICEVCGWPIIKIIRKGKKPQEICINKDCPSKKNDNGDDKQQYFCPKCNSKLIARKSIYNSFYGCSNYPKCKFITTDPANLKKEVLDKKVLN